MPAPNQLEEIQPSWLLDGLGITGEQTDRDHNDDTQWDLLAWSRDDQDQEDFIKKCCCIVSLSCDQISASKTKCGFSDFTGGGSGGPWLTKTVVQNHAFGPINIGSGCSCTPLQANGSSSATDIYTVDPDTCGITCSRSGTGSSSQTCTNIFGSHTLFTCSYTRNDGSGADCTPPYQGSGIEHQVFYNCDGTINSEGDVLVVDTFVDGEYLPFGCGGDAGNTESLTPTVKTITYTTPGFSGSAVITLSDSNTEDVCATAVSLLPAYDDDYNDPCQALLESSGNTCTVSRFKPKFTIPSAKATDQAICYNEHFVPEVGDPTNTPRTVTILSGDTTVIGDEVLEPGTNGVITITDVRCC